ncbi:hypothetical protein GCM10010435_30260 [Winogradskya consettensis]|uniref:SnoaL-like domain-containing protein n=1 Tax=Winogradskya consettensis TaxID=113560 RepID=A0A919VV72_9ACTN|nr:nuclear transport factor 2 family protein [Actinoplanes consettensis]GIM70618.1 hypothetical protein Aco04nite_21240 [Actinoplanes consettensis]
MLTTDDRLAIHELLALHGHLMDDGAFDQLPTLFTDDITYDVTAFGGGVLTGFAAITAAALTLGDRNPVAHHVTNIRVETTPHGTIRARSKGLGITTDGLCGSVTYDDTLRRTPAGWRISHRTVTPRRTPLHP